MAIKSKISNIKKNNQKRTKLIKQGVIKKTKKQKRSNEVHTTKISKTTQESDEESCQGADMLEMVDEDDMEFLKQSITNKSYHFYKKIKCSESSEPRSKKQKLVEDNEVLHSQYWTEVVGNDNTQLKYLLPIKTNKGIVQQQIEENYEEKPTDISEAVQVTKNRDTLKPIELNLEDELQFDPSKPISATQLYINRREVLRRKKIEIGSLCAGLLENPEEKIVNFRILLSMMDVENHVAYLTIRKVIMISLTEVFKDILPSYEIKCLNKEGVKLKKDTLKLQKYEDMLLDYYKKFLKKLEKYVYMLMKKSGGNPLKQDQNEIKLATLAVQSMCELLVRHSYFNFSENIAQALTPFLNNSNRDVRQLVKTSFTTVFKEDKREDLTLKILRNINTLVKTHLHHLHADTLQVLLVLNLRNVNLDQQKEQDLKQKKIMKHKSRVLQMSKKERKRKRHLIELEKELLETKAEENKQIKQKNVTEITKLLFNIYFRILKCPSNKRVLGLCLQGLGKYAHCINLEYYVDVVNVLDSLLKGDTLTYVDKLHCVQTVFAILGGQGEALNIDPTRFYNNLYKDLLSVDATTRQTHHLKNLISTLMDALIKRRRKIPTRRMVAFVKRLATLALQLTHDGALSSLALIRNVMQSNRNVDILLDCESSLGEGKYRPEMDDPEYSNASSTAAYELIHLSRHYHPVVRLYARNICHGVPATGDACLPVQYGKIAVPDLLDNFDMSQMSFNPPVPVPKPNKPKNTARPHYFCDTSFEDECRDILRQRKFQSLLQITI